MAAGCTVSYTNLLVLEDLICTEVDHERLLGYECLSDCASRAARTQLTMNVTPTCPVVISAATDVWGAQSSSACIALSRLQGSQEIVGQMSRGMAKW